MQLFNVSKLLKKHTAYALALSVFTFTACEQDDNDTFIDDNDFAKVFVSSNTNSALTVFDLSPEFPVDNTPQSSVVGLVNDDADGLHYNSTTDVLYQLDRTNDRVSIYQNFSRNGASATLTPNSTSSSDFTNGREVTISPDGRYLVVAQDRDEKMDNRFMIYFITPFGLELERIYETPIDLWGIHFEGDHLFAVEDNTANLVGFYDFLTNEDGSTVEPTVRLNIEGARHLRGVDYDGVNDIMFLTDVGTLDRRKDGAIIVITDFSQKAGKALSVESPTLYQSFGFLLSSEQIRIKGSKTQLGDPMDVAFCRQNLQIYVAERLNNGGELLAFDLPVEIERGLVNTKPAFREAVTGASAVAIGITDIPGF
ncbi:MAG: hypothetical protein AAGK47_04495 [Bacteroidota bacterium]